jgi:hypothetical protein
MAASHAISNLGSPISKRLLMFLDELFFSGD